MTTIVIVPYRADNGHRDRLWTFVRENYWVNQPYEIVIGHHTDGLFNRSRAINQAADRDWDVAIIADADTWVPAKQLHQALLTANITKSLVAAFDTVVELSQPCTDKLLRGNATLAGNFEATTVRTRDMETQSSMLVINRALFDQVGGFDERFQGWGGEDSAFWKACTLHAGQPHRITGNAYHLWHSPAKGKFHGIDYQRNLNLWRRYEAAQSIEDLPC